MSAHPGTASFNQNGIDVLGLASGQLSSLWAEGEIQGYDPKAMTLRAAEPVRWLAMVGGTLCWRAFGTPELTDAGGAALRGAVAVLCFHPQAYLRLRRLYGRRYEGRSDGRSLRPVPLYAAIRGGTPPAELEGMEEGDPPLAPESAPAGLPLATGTLSFHDIRGLIIDPLAVASALRDLLRAWPALRREGAGAFSDALTEAEACAEGLPGPAPGGLGALVTRASGRRLHLVDLFGGPWRDRPEATGLRLGAGERLGAGPHDWEGGDLEPASADAGALRWGFSADGVMGSTPLAPPDLPEEIVPAGAPAPCLERDFLRVTVVDLALHLTGNRGEDLVSGVPGPDEGTRLEHAPVVRDGQSVEHLPDGQTTMGAIAEIAGIDGFRLLASPVIEDDVLLPMDRLSHWPAFPLPLATPEDMSAEACALARSSATAAYAGDSPDVVLSWPPGVLPAEACVRVFPRLDLWPAAEALAEHHLARRGDGVAAIVGADPVALLLRDPFGAGAGARPADPEIRFDLLVVSRGPSGVKAHLLGGLCVGVGAGGAPGPAEAVVSNEFAAVSLGHRGVAPAPVLGLPPTVPARGDDPVLAELAETAPREAPRFRTQARTESIAVSHDGARWVGALTPGWLAGRSVRGDARFGNPGNPAGPEEHAPGLRVQGGLAQDLARAALRRTHPLQERLAELEHDRWGVVGPGAGTAAGAVLHTVAETVEEPELSQVPASVARALPEEWDTAMAALDGLLPPALASLATAVPAPGAGPRWVEELRRQAMAAQQGRRDALWAWRWALSHARSLVFLETALLSRTGSGASEHEVDLVELLEDRLAHAPDLHVILSLPRRVPFGPGYEGFAQHFYLARNAVIDRLKALAPDRVVVYHPVGFPGRPEVIRGTVAVVDDVWALVGSSTFSRRGLTFDGGVDMVFTDMALHDGVCGVVRALRRRALARTFGLKAPEVGQVPAAAWVQLADPRSAFRYVSDVLSRGGDGLVEPLWRGLSRSELAPLSAALADPEGRRFPFVLGSFVDVLAELGGRGV